MTAEDRLNDTEWPTKMQTFLERIGGMAGELCSKR